MSAHNHNKAVTMAHSLRCISRNTWGINSKTSQTIYKCAIEPAITYGAEIWGEAANKQNIKKRLNSIQRMSLISIAKAYRTSLTNALQVISNILPLDLKVLKLYFKYQLLGQRANSIQTPIVHASMEELIKDIQNYGLDAQQKANIVHPAEPNPEITETPAINDKTYNVFTDGSKSAEGVGCALVVNNTSGKSIYQACFKLGMQCSNNQAESLAILKALQYIRDKPIFRNKTIRINSDSKTALAQIRKLRTKLTIVQETINLLMLLRGKGIKILLNWVKGHSEITGNE
ncbi:uncharacterized protein [Centruroides vittatus]|uniref:uncharacterized protein n=1 Tax=Centruroides vittatus TaxID=120091 RepID=UPI0035102B03